MITTLLHDAARLFQQQTDAVECLANLRLHVGMDILRPLAGNEEHSTGSARMAGE